MISGKSRTIINTSYFIIICILLFFVANIVLKKREDLKGIANLPKFSFMNLSGEEYNSDSINRENLMIVFFNTDCYLCWDEIQLISSSNKLLDKFQILLVSEQDLQKLIEFKEDFPFVDKQLKILSYSVEEVGNTYFKIRHTPSTYIFYKGQLVNKYEFKLNDQIIESLTKQNTCL